ncbi:MAG TPA: DUF4411 family protein [Nitrospirae bacterium]|nr:DUF4411 family protein [Nitrospirota bacterium]HDK17441.1 DUF4411 family protein [Nitrospirota bacterium]
MSSARPYLLDADVFIAAKNSYYSFGICPGFWDSLIHHHGEGSVLSIDKVKGELLAGRKDEDLVQWVKSELSARFFIGTDDEAVTSAYADIMLWVQRNPQYLDHAKAKFATEADGWLVAYAMAHEGIVITNEQPRPQSRSRILLPDVCSQFNVTYKDIFFMLRDLAVQFKWRSPA